VAQEAAGRGGVIGIAARAARGGENRGMTRPTLALLAGLVLVLAAPAAVPALDLTPRDFHARAGLSLEPDQLHAGVHATLGSPGRLAFRPGLDLGVGNGVVLVSLNGDVLYRFSRQGRIRPFLGGGPALSLVDVTDGVGESDGVSAELAGHLVGGLQWLPPAGKAGRRYFVETRFGFGDTPEFKATVGIGF
jgi:hypothetical protein